MRPGAPLPLETAPADLASQVYAEVIAQSQEADGREADGPPGSSVADPAKVKEAAGQRIGEGTRQVVGVFAPVWMAGREGGGRQPGAGWQVDAELFQAPGSGSGDRAAPRDLRQQTFGEHSLQQRHARSSGQVTVADPGEPHCLARLGLAQRPHGGGGRQHRQRLNCPGDRRISDLEVPVLAALVNLQEAGLDQPGEVKARRRRAEAGEGGKFASGQLTVLPQRQQQPYPGGVSKHARHGSDINIRTHRQSPTTTVPAARPSS